MSRFHKQEGSGLIVLLGVIATVAVLATVVNVARSVPVRRTHDVSGTVVGCPAVAGSIVSCGAW